MRIRNLKFSEIHFSRSPFFVAARGPSKARRFYASGAEKQGLHETFKQLSTYFKDFTPMSDVYIGLLGIADVSFLKACHAVLVVLQRKQALLKGLRNSKQRDAADVWETPPSFSEKEWMSEVFRQRLHGLARRKNDASQGSLKPLVKLYADVLDDLDGNVVKRAENLIFSIRKQAPGWWDLKDDNAAESDLLESVRQANDDLEDFLGEKQARYIGEPELAEQRLAQALGRYAGIGVEMARLTGNRLDPPSADRIGDSEILNDYFLNLFDFFSFQTWVRGAIARTPADFFVGDFGAVEVFSPEAPTAAVSPPAGFLFPDDEMRGIKRVIKTYLIKQRANHEETDLVKPVLLDWFDKLQHTRFQSVLRILRALREELDPKNEEMKEAEVEVDTEQMAYLLGKGLVRFPIEKKYLFFTLKRLASELPHGIREVTGASDFRDFPTHHLSPVKKLYFISACRFIAFLAEMKRLRASLANNLKFADVDNIYPELIPPQNGLLWGASAAQAPVPGPAPRPKVQRKFATLQDRLSEECADLEALLKKAGKLYSQLLTQFQTGNIEPLAGLEETIQALRITFERAQRAKPRNLGS